MILTRYEPTLGVWGREHDGSPVVGGQVLPLAGFAPDGAGVEEARCNAALFAASKDMFAAIGLAAAMTEKLQAGAPVSDAEVDRLRVSLMAAHLKARGLA